MNIFGVGLPEMAVIGAVALLVFGPKNDFLSWAEPLGKNPEGIPVRFERIRARDQ